MKIDSLKFLFNMRTDGTRKDIEDILAGISSDLLRTCPQNIYEWLTKNCQPGERYFTAFLMKDKLDKLGNINPMVLKIMEDDIKKYEHQNVSRRTKKSKSKKPEVKSTRTLWDRTPLIGINPRSIPGGLPRN